MVNLKFWTWGRKAAEAIDQKAFAREAVYNIVGGQIISSPDNRRSYIQNGYNINDHIYSAVNLILDKVKIAPWGVYKVKDESSLKLYEGLMAKKSLSGDDYRKALALRTKALEAYDKDDILNRLIKYPNPDQCMNEFVTESSLFKLITGGRTILATVLDAGANKGKPYELNHLPYQDILLVVSTSFPMKILGYRLGSILFAANDQVTFPASSVMHDKYPNPNYDTAGSHLYGFAPLKSALRLTDRSNSSNRAATASFQNMGPANIVFMDSDKYDPADFGATAVELKKRLQSKEYTGPDNNNKNAFSGHKIGVVPLGLSPKDLTIIESEKWDLRRFCNIFSGLPSQALNDPENKTYNNAKEGEKAITTRGAMPLLNSFRDSFNRKLDTDWGYKDEKIYIDYDVSVFTELQDDLKEKWGWVRELPVPWAYKLDLMGMDYDEGQTGLDEVMIPTGFQPIDALTVVDEELDTSGDPKAGKK